MCLDILFDTEHSKVTSNYSKSSKGNRKKRPFSFNEIKNLFEAR
jgi:hypothetical protein